MGAPENPPAFPTQDSADGGGFQCGVQLWQYPGMTLRDWFAGQALGGATSSIESETASRNAARAMGIGTSAFIARICYQYADAMLAARTRTGEEA